MRARVCCWRSAHAAARRAAPQALPATRGIPEPIGWHRARHMRDRERASPRRRSASTGRRAGLSASLATAATGEASPSERADFLIRQVSCSVGSVTDVSAKNWSIRGMRDDRAIPSATRRDLLLSLPNDIGALIFTHLGIDDHARVHAAAKVTRAWSRAALSAVRAIGPVELRNVSGPWLLIERPLRSARVLDLFAGLVHLEIILEIGPAKCTPRVGAACACLASPQNGTARRGR